MLNKKAYLQISFSWMFAIIVGAIILFLAIYFLTNFIKSGQTEQTTKTSKEIGILLNPLEVGFEQGKKSVLTTSTETRIYPRCNLYGEFGRQGIAVKEKLYDKWSGFGQEVSFRNKYIFSEEYVEGKEFYLFSKPFEFPFKVASLIYLIPAKEEYCFISAPEEVNDEINNLDFENIFIKSFNQDSCSGDEINVCFSSGISCDIYVDCSEEDCSEGSVTKGESQLYFYTNSLMYGAIFSNENIYECQLKRLLKRTNTLSTLYEEKLSLTSLSTCQNYISDDLSLFKSSINSYVNNEETSSEDMTLIFSISKDLYGSKFSPCRLL